MQRTVEDVKSSERRRNGSGCLRLLLHNVVHSKAGWIEGNNTRKSALEAWAMPSLQTAPGAGCSRIVIVWV